MFTNETIQCGCAVIGAGAAGMMAAITAARQGIDVVLLEHTKRAGSKILQTGNGKCNFTNTNMSPECYNHDSVEFVKRVLEMFDENAAISFFEELGVYHKNRNGYIYPHSETAASLQDALRLELERLAVRLISECEISDIKNTGDGFELMSQMFTVNATKVIIATGSKASPKTGSDGSGYRYAKKFGHRIVKPLPALVQLESDMKLCRAMAGVRSNGNVVLTVDGREVCRDSGEVQYTEYGISGIPVFQISRYAVKGVDMRADVVVIIDMIPDMTMDDLCQDVRIRYERDGLKSVEQFFAGILNKKLVCAAAKLVGVDINRCISSVPLRKLYDIIAQLKEFEFNITGFKDFDHAQVCQGGVAIDDINPQTMESKLCKGLFFAGEVVDVDGICGGYNLQWAWSSGYVAGLN